MKLKKDNVRKSILDASKEEFFLKGYKDANMRSIAERANITPGNIYRYYSSKEELLDAVVGQVNKAIGSVTRLESVIPSNILKNSKAMVDFFINTALDIIIRNKYEAIILLSRTRGSKYENAGEAFIEFAAQSIDKTRKESNIDMSRVIARSVVKTEMDILEEFIDSEEKIKSISFEFLTTIFSKNYN